MANLLVVTFANQQDARSAMVDMRNLEKAGGTSIQDLEAIERDANGKIQHVGSQIDNTTKTGIVGGGLLGLMIGLVFFPVLGVALGAIAGGVIGKSMGDNIDKKLINDVADDLTPGTSALFVLLDGGPGGALLDLLRRYKFKLYETSLDPEMEQQLRDMSSSAGKG
jgi:uncharacterized membrane protein